MTGTDAAWIIASGAGTIVGGLGVLLLGRPRPRVADGLLGFTAGVMLAAAIFSLLVPALDRGTPLEALGGLVAGAAVLAVADTVIPHLHAVAMERSARARSAEVAQAERRALLLLAALTIHNVPEGLAVGVAFAAGGTELGVPVAVAIGLQNIPEGFVAGIPLRDAGMSRGRAAVVAGATGLVEPPAAFLAVAALGLASGLLPVGLGFAAGAMLYVVIDELIPESHGHGHERTASAALVAGFVLMAALDLGLG